MDSLTPDQAQALWDAGGFVILSGLEEGSEFGIDGTFHIVRRFSGIKFLPPGFHLIAWSTTTPSLSALSVDPSSRASGAGAGGAGPSNVPIRHSLLICSKAKQRIILRYDPKTELVSADHGNADGEGGAVISDGHLRALDKEMAPYPFESLDLWKSLTSEITPELLEAVVGDGRVDGLTSVEGEEEDSDERQSKALAEAQKQDSAIRDGGATDGINRLKFVRFKLRRSWRHGAVGEEVTKYSRDKSWLLGNVVEKQLGGDLSKLLGQLQLSYILLLHLSSYSALMVYKRILALLCQSSSFLMTPRNYLSSSFLKNIQKVYKTLLEILAFQINCVPDGTFDTELPEMDVFYMDQIEALKLNLSAAMWSKEKWSQVVVDGVIGAWKKLEITTKKWGWEIGELAPVHADTEGSDDEEEEEGEYAPIIVDM